MIKFLIFNIKKKWKRIPLIVLLAILMVFIFTQVGAIFHYPIKSDIDLHKLEESGEISYLYKKKTDTEIKEQLRDNIEKTIEDTDEDYNISSLKALLKDLDYYTLDELIEKSKEDNISYAYLKSNIQEIKMEYKSYGDINKDLLENTNNKGYQVEFQKNYITYIQAIIAFLLIPFVIVIFEEDDRYNIRESMKITSNEYLKFFITELCTVLIPIIIFTYILGVGLNLYSYMKFHLAGYNVKYLPITTKYCLYFIPSLICFTSVLILIISKSKNYMSLIPLYLVWVIFNITPRATKLPKIFESLLVLYRLDTNILDGNNIVFRQLFIVILSIIILMLSYYKRREEIL
jgi:putative membrane protein